MCEYQRTILIPWESVCLIIRSTFSITRFTIYIFFSLKKIPDFIDFFSYFKFGCFFFFRIGLSKKTKVLHDFIGDSLPTRKSGSLKFGVDYVKHNIDIFCSGFLVYTYWDITWRIRTCIGSGWYATFCHI